MKRILIVDDVRLMADLRTTPLGRADVEIVPLRCGEDAVARAREVRPAFVVLEEGEFFPEAFDALRSLQRHPATAELPVLYIGLSLERDLALLPGLTEFVPKPARRHELERACLRMLRADARRTARRAVDVACALLQDGRSNPGRCVELSLGGAFVLLDHSVAAEKGTLVLPNGKGSIELPVEVVREGKDRHAARGWGLRFVDLGPRQGAQLARFTRAAAERRGQAQETGTREPIP